MARRLSRRALATHLADEVVAGNGAKTIKQIAAYLVESRRTKEVDLVVRDAEYLLARRGYVAATVTTAFPLSEAANKAMTSLIKAQTGATHISVDNPVDPEVLGGFRLSLPGQILDRTIRHQLTVLRTRFKKA
jgi:F-type H+-transporting ATPase subunit delta